MALVECRGRGDCDAVGGSWLCKSPIQRGRQGSKWHSCQAWKESCVLTPSGAGTGPQVKVLALFSCLVST